MVKTVIGSGGAALVNSAAFFAVFDLYTLTLTTGQVIRLTTADFDVYDLSSNVYSCGGSGSSVPGMPKIDLKGSKVQGHWKRGLDSDSWQVVLMPDVASQFTGALTYPTAVGSIPWLTACRFGMFDTAQVQVDRAYFANPLQPPLTVALRTPGAIVEKVFFGVVGTVDWNDTTSVFTINDFKYLMKTQMPRNLFQGECRHQLFDAGCTLNAASYAQTGTVLTGCTQSLILATPPAPTGATSYRGGRIVFTSGQNNGFQATIQAWDGIQSFQLLTPLPFAPAAGDAFTIYPGCDKSLGSQGCGVSGFNNILNFGGECFIPVPELQLG